MLIMIVWYCYIVLVVPISSHITPLGTGTDTGFGKEGAPGWRSVGHSSHSSSELLTRCQFQNRRAFALPTLAAYKIIWAE